MRRSAPIDPIERTNLTLSAGAVFASLALVSPAFAASLAVGSLLEAVNFRGLRRTAQVLCSTEPAPRHLGFWGFAPRLALLAVALGVALRAGAHPVGLLIGLSLILPAAVIETWRAWPPVDPNAPALPPEDESWELWNPWLARERNPESLDEDEEIRA